MKKAIGRLCALLLAVLLLAALVGCGTQPDAAAPEQTPAGADAPTEQTPAEKPADGSGEEKPAVPSEEEVLAAYQTADEAYGWFARNTMPLKQGFVDYTDEAGRDFYQEADMPEFPTLASLRVYLLTLFSDSFVDGLLEENGPCYRDIGGKLCALDCGGSGSIYKQDEPVITVEPVSDSRVDVIVTISVMDDELTAVDHAERFVFPYEYTGGRWCFTDFAWVFSAEGERIDPVG